MKKPLQILLISLILHLLLLITNCYSQWVQQTLPVGGLVYDIAFFDASTGLVSMDTPALLRTTNGGINWTAIANFRIYCLQKIDTLTAYGNGRRGVSDMIYRTTNSGISWDSVAITPASYDQISFINKDTGWVCGYDGGSGAVWQTTNGGQALQQQLAFGGPILTIFFAKQRYGTEYYGWYSSGGLLFNTTNSGVNWTQYTNLPNNNAGYIYFLNKDTGWVSNFNGSQNYTMFTTNNGVNWTTQNLPSTYGAGDLNFYNNNTGWGAGGFGKVVATTNGGSNWGTQNAPFFTVNTICFINDMTGWCGGNGIAKTTNGGGNIIYDGIEQISNEIPVSFKLYQNYPNPFNPITNFKIQIPKLSLVKIILYDILGREIKILLNENLKPGSYKVDFNASELPSGVYIYKLVTDNYMESKKMILVK